MAVYCAGTDTWYVRIGGRHGQDPMIKCGDESHAAVKAKHINDALSRLVSARESKRSS
jgi:hypothetical protein